MTTVPTVSPTELIRSSWGNTVATELNTKTVKVDGSMPMTGPLVINASPGLRLRRAGDAPFLQFENTTGATRFGYVQGATGRVTYAVDGVGIHQFLVNGAEVFKVDATGAVTSAGVDVNAGGVRIGGNGGQLSLIDTSTSGNDFHDAYMQFFGAGVSMVSPGTRTGYVGYAGSTTLSVRNEVAGGAVSVNALGAVTVTGGATVAVAGSVITLSSGGAERGRVNGSLMWGKTVAGSANVGVELFESGTVYSTVTAGTNLLLRHNGAADADQAPYIQFNASGTQVSQIEQDKAAPVGIHIDNCTVTAPSDARLKNDLGGIEQATARLARLRPHRFTWKAHPETERDGFFADEVAGVVPEAVFGAADAVDAAGGVVAQQLDRSALIPLLTAAVQELAGRLDVLEAN